MNVNVEIVLKESSSVVEEEIIGVARSYLNRSRIQPGTVISEFDKKENPILYEDVEHIVVDEINFDFSNNYSSKNIRWHVYKLNREGPQNEVFHNDEGGEINIATQYVLPAHDLFNLWENLIYEHNIKDKLLNYAQTMMEFSDKGIDPNVISCNRVILLHGPPGTGKTSLCRALAQKLGVHMKDKYKKSVLVEINSFNLFSKWFSESAKLVNKLFSKVREIVEMPKMLVCLLIDEVESLAHARDQCLSGNEPSDAIKVVNGVLTQIDQIKRYPNVIILTTSNMMAAIDVAFVDRADVKQYIGPPSVGAIYRILMSCMKELIKKKILNVEFREGAEEAIYSEEVMEISKTCLDMSGRMLRKIPFLARALFMDQHNCSVDEFLKAMRKAIVFENEQYKLLLGKLEKGIM